MNQTLVSLLSVNAYNSPQPPPCPAYTPFGFSLVTEPTITVSGFNGVHREPVGGSYLLGNGYRAYNPFWGRFHSPDTLSPFGGGGLNTYIYVLGDPINRTDPSGHIGESLLRRQSFAGFSALTRRSSVYRTYNIFPEQVDFARIAKLERSAREVIDTHIENELLMGTHFPTLRQRALAAVPSENRPELARILKNGMFEETYAARAGETQLNQAFKNSERRMFEGTLLEELKGAPKRPLAALIDGTQRQDTARRNHYRYLLAQVYEGAGEAIPDYGLNNTALGADTARVRNMAIRLSKYYPQ